MIKDFSNIIIRIKGNVSTENQAVFNGIIELMKINSSENTARILDSLKFKGVHHEINTDNVNEHRFK